MSDLDSIDIQILQMLQADGRITHAELAHRVGLTAPTVVRRVRLLEERGYICGYTTLLDPLALGLTVTAFTLIESQAGCDLGALGRDLAAFRGVQEVHRIIGEWCFLIKIRAATPQHLEQLVNGDLRGHPMVRRTFTTLATSTDHETTRLPLPEAV
jgi:Lrp/AsnC family transcriptional regulator, leucine-responsive regulatory protein